MTIVDMNIYKDEIDGLDVLAFGSKDPDNIDARVQAFVEVSKRLKPAAESDINTILRTVATVTDATSETGLLTALEPEALDMTPGDSTLILVRMSSETPNFEIEIGVALFLDDGTCIGKSPYTHKLVCAGEQSSAGVYEYGVAQFDSLGAYKACPYIVSVVDTVGGTSEDVTFYAEGI